MLTLLLACALGQAEILEPGQVERVLRPTAESIEQATVDLGAAEFAVREQASLYLWCCGARAKDALQKAIVQGDLEVRTRATQILQAIEAQRMPKITDARLRGVMQCRMGKWEEGREALVGADALDLLQLMADEYDSEQARSARKQQNLDWLNGLSDADRKKVQARWEHANAWHEALEKQDWGALYKLAENIREGWLRGTTLRMALLRELGREADAPQVLEEVRARVASEPIMCGKAVGELVMAGYPEAALALNMEYDRAGAMHMLADDLRFREGFEVLGIGLPLADPESWLERIWAGRKDQDAKKVDWSSRIWKVCHVAVIAARLGEDDVGRRLIVKAGELAEQHPEHPTLYTAWEHELKVGLDERAWAHYGLWLKDKNSDERNAALSWRHHEAAGTWWSFLETQSPSAPKGELARGVKSLVDPKASKAQTSKDAQQWIEKIRASASALSGDERANALQAGAVACDAHELRELSHELWKEVEALRPSGQSALALADHFYATERWNDASTWYGQAWARDRKQLFVLALQAKSLERAGRQEEADRAKQLARLWPTGNDDERMQIPFQLQGRGQMDLAQEQYVVARRYLARPYDWVWIFMSEAEEKIDSAPAEAARLWNLVRMLSFGDNVMLTGDEVEGQNNGEQETLQRIHYLRATSLIDSKEYDAALREALIAEAAQPAGSKMALELVRFFDETGQKKGGDRVFEQMWLRRRKVVEDFPRAAEFHQQLAAMGAACKRRLEESLAHAERAVSLRPKHIGSRLTAALVQMARGQYDAAQAQISEALTIEPLSAEAARVQRELNELRRGQPK